MEFLYKQMRGRLSSLGDDKEDENRSARDKRTQPQKTQSFKGEKKRTPSWFQRPFSRQMSRDYSRDGDDYQAAVAAAAFAIQSLEESRSRDRKRESRSQDTALTKVKSKPDESAREPEPRTRSVKFPEQGSRSKSDITDTRVPIRTQTMEEVPEQAVGPAPSFKKTPTFGDHLKPEDGVPGKAIGPASSMRRTSTSGDKSFDNGTSRRLGSPLSKPQAETRRQSSTQSGSSSTEADEWEKAEMAKIKAKYEKLNTTIFNWEDKKKTKAKRQLDKIEAELDKKRAKAMQEYREKIVRIDNIAGGAKAQAEENRRNEEFKVKEKANKLRLTGKLPRSCLCF